MAMSTSLLFLVVVVAITYGDCPPNPDGGTWQLKDDDSGCCSMSWSWACGTWCARASCKAKKYESSFLSMTCCPPSDSAKEKSSTKCPPIKVRKEWSGMSQSKRNNYINSFKKLANKGIVQQMANAHAQAWDQAHSNSKFFPWHRQFLLALESEIRKLPGQKCFSLPYWDWSNEPTPKDVKDKSEKLIIIDSGLGGDSPNPSTDKCIMDGPFRKGQFDPHNGDCLRRDVDYTTDGDCMFTQPSDLMDRIDKTNKYKQYRPSIEGAPHANPHVCIGGSMNSRHSPDDPVFYLHHAFVDYLYALWQDCTGYDGKPHSSSSNMYDGDVDTLLTFSPLSSSINIKIKDVTDINTLKYSYEKGPFWDNANVDGAGNCDDAINPKWFVNSRRRRNRRRLVAGDSKDKAQNAYQALKGSGLQGKELTQKWSVKVCEDYAQSIHHVCPMPDTYEDCRDLGKYPYNALGDIDITLDELLAKSGINDCMKKTRKTYFHWAKLTRSLRALCDGCYDKFCNKPQSLEDQCVKDFNIELSGKSNVDAHSEYQNNLFDHDNEEYEYQNSNILYHGYHTNVNYIIIMIMTCVFVMIGIMCAALFSGGICGWLMAKNKNYYTELF